MVGILVALGTAVIVGVAQGGLIAGFRLNSMPVTLGGYLVVLGTTYILGHGKSVIYEDYNVGLRLDKPILQIFSIRSLVAICIFVVTIVALRYLRVGRDIRAIGGDLARRESRGRLGRPAAHRRVRDVRARRRPRRSAAQLQPRDGQPHQHRGRRPDLLGHGGTPGRGQAVGRQGRRDRHRGRRSL